MKFQRVIAAIALLLSLLGQSANAASNGKVKVFLLAGQSNMVGYGALHARNASSGDAGTMDHYVVKNPAAYGHLVNDDGSHVVRDDVWVINAVPKESKPKSKFKTNGWLTTGFGHDEHYIGPEYGFGFSVGEHFDEPVVIIKCAWGGRSLAVNFLSPSSETYPKPTEDGDKGFQYAEIVRLTKDILANLKQHYPAYEGQGYELVGFGWHQGWNDRTKPERVKVYGRNLENLIKDLRKDLGIEKLPVVIANTGMNGRSVSDQAEQLMNDQLALADPAKYPHFAGNVGAVDTRGFQRKREESPSKQGFHWFRNWETYYLIGDAMGKKMVELLEGD